MLPRVPEFAVRDVAWPTFPIGDHIPKNPGPLVDEQSQRQIGVKRSRSIASPLRSEPRRHCETLAGEDRLLRIPGCKTRAQNQSAWHVPGPEHRKARASLLPEAAGLDVEMEDRSHDALDRKMDTPSCAPALLKLLAGMWLIFQLTDCTHSAKR
jgi:hypothetical protein